ncbi:Protein of unknown function [Seinonella peptonophila]|uniref:PD-(D/E)XK nuclease superfamily protein n=1 Tax=Seinonella peptonophila TaxID=112248 RepID=A0A1M5A0K0_9BACL|nr:Protein of unknown function [Seinonella peptonophila]
MAEQWLNYHLKHDSKSPEGPTEMMKYVGTYVKEVLEKRGEIYIERRLDYSPWVPGGFGTSDAVILTDSTIEIMDLKYEKGSVSAMNNPQLRLYGLGAVHKFGRDFKKIRMTIVQPRLNNRHPKY